MPSKVIWALVALAAIVLGALFCGYSSGALAADAGVINALAVAAAGGTVNSAADAVAVAQAVTGNSVPDGMAALEYLASAWSVLPWWGSLLLVLLGVHPVASLITAVTPTPKDNKALSKVYSVIELLALVVFKAKDPGGKKK